MKPFLNPRVNGYFEMYAGTSGITFLQNIVDGSRPIAVFNSLDKSVEFLGGWTYLTFLIQQKFII